MLLYSTSRCHGNKMEFSTVVAVVVHFQLFECGESLVVMFIRRPPIVVQREVGQPIVAVLDRCCPGMIVLFVFVPQRSPFICKSLV